MTRFLRKSLPSKECHIRGSAIVIDLHIVKDTVGSFLQVEHSESQLYNHARIYYHVVDAVGPMWVDATIRRGAKRASALGKGSATTYKSESGMYHLHFNSIDFMTLLFRAKVEVW